MPKMLDERRVDDDGLGDSIDRFFREELRAAGFQRWEINLILVARDHAQNRAMTAALREMPTPPQPHRARKRPK